MLTDILFAIIGLSSGIAVSAGTFAFIFSLGVIERMADFTHTAKYLRVYESVILFGATCGNLISVYKLNINIGTGLTAVFGLLSGVFVGIMAIALVEILKSMPIMFRRANLHKGLGIVILCIALGKMFGSFVQFWLGWTA